MSKIGYATSLEDGDNIHTNDDHVDEEVLRVDKDDSGEVI
jgi:hypothetical protein